MEDEGKKSVLVSHYDDKLINKENVLNMRILETLDAFAVKVLKKLLKYDERMYVNNGELKQIVEIKRLDIGIQGVTVFKNGFAEIIFSDGETMLIDDVITFGTEYDLVYPRAPLITIPVPLYKDIHISEISIKKVIVYKNREGELVLSNGERLYVQNVYSTESELASFAQINIGIKTDL